MRHGDTVYHRRRERHLPRMAETFLAKRSRQSQRRRARHSGRLAFCCRRLVESLLCVLLVGYSTWWSCLRSRSKRLVRRGRHLFFFTHHGGDPGAPHSESPCAPREALPPPLPAS